MKLLIISGRSGSGKSAALHMLEDLNYYCVDNLPVALLPALIENLKDSLDNVAVSIDARNLPKELEKFAQVIKDLRESQEDFQIIYLDADDNTLFKRFGETRRKHPLKKRALKEAIEAEKKLLEPVADCATLQIDTSHLSVKQLREVIYSRIHSNTQPSPSIMFQSFGYKHGIPTDTDFTFDVRCLPNPYWEKPLREKTGLDKEVISYLDTQQQVQNMLQDIESFITHWLPAFEKENRKYLTVSIGCTGGQHRSVYLVEKLGKFFTNKRENISIRHRELS